MQIPTVVVRAFSANWRDEKDIGS